MPDLFKNKVFWYIIGIAGVVLVYYIWFKPMSQGANQPGAVLRQDGTLGTGMVGYVQPGKGFAVSNPVGPGIPGAMSKMGTVSAAYNGDVSLLAFN